jgi:Protein of unknown function (DUF2480)
MEIVNKVAQSGLITIDLEELYPAGEQVVLDIKPWLFEELILKEKDFREYIIKHDWEQYRSKHVAVLCSADAIVPTWAYMLIAAQLAPVAQTVFFGGLEEMSNHLFYNKLSQLDPVVYKDQRIVIKGCSGREVPVAAYLEITRLLQPYVKSIMYGEPCSTVPVFKRKD